jgi:hypothetical protein
MLIAVAALAMIQTPNALTPDEVKAGWKLLFNGTNTEGWHNYRAKGVRPGWVVKDGVLTSADIDRTGDIVTDEQFDWFELTLDYNLAKGQNSGVMYHVTDSGDTTWQSGPEIQLYDDQGAAGAEKSGWLYQLYESKVDSTKPAGEWNHLRILVSPQICETEVNGVKYYDYVLGSEDFWTRVKKSKFNAYPGFAKSNTGSIAIQGDHGVVSFRNIKIRPIKG